MSSGITKKITTYMGDRYYHNLELLNTQDINKMEEFHVEMRHVWLIVLTYGCCIFLSLTFLICEIKVKRAQNIKIKKTRKFKNIPRVKTVKLKDYNNKQQQKLNQFKTA